MNFRRLCTLCLFSQRNPHQNHSWSVSVEASALTIWVLYLRFILILSIEWRRSKWYQAVSGLGLLNTPFFTLSTHNCFMIVLVDRKVLYCFLDEIDWKISITFFGSFSSRILVILLGYFLVLNDMDVGLFSDFVTPEQNCPVHPWLKVGPQHQRMSTY